jgi:ribonuclease PH
MSALSRPDGRAFNQLRPISIELDAMPRAEGSALIKCGDTHVLCSASVLDHAPEHARSQGNGWITAEYSLLPRSTHSRTQRERQKVKGRTQEIQRLIGRSLRAASNLRALAGYTVIIDCDVIRADAGTRCASIVGGFVALARASAELRRQKKIKRSVLNTFVSAVSTAVVDGQPILDPTYEEDFGAEVDMNIVMTSEGLFVEVQGSAEGAPFSGENLDAMLKLGREGCEEMIKAQKSVLGIDNPADL